MNEIIGDLFDPPVRVDAICITTNGEVDRHGCAIMGRGVALEARKRWPAIADVLGRRLAEYGIGAMLLSCARANGIFLDDLVTPLPFHIITLPTKNRWREPSTPALIRQSLIQVRGIVDGNDFKLVALPRPGCANGRLEWSAVKPIVEECLPDERWLVVHPLAG